MDIVKYMSYGLLIGVPVAVTFCEKIGCPAAVSGPSMRVIIYSVMCKNFATLSTLCTTTAHLESCNFYP